MNTEGEDCGLDQHDPEVCASGQYLDFSAADRWISNEFERALIKVHKGFEDYRFDIVASAMYQFVWDEFCDWYLEIAKVQIQTGDEAQRRATRRTLIRTLEKSLRMAHPVIPFITEELWQKVAPVAGLSGKSVMVSPYPKLNLKSIDAGADSEINTIKNMVTACRTLKAEMGIGPSERYPLIIAGDTHFLEKWRPVISTLTKSQELQLVGDQLPDRDSPVVTIEGYALMLHIEIDPQKERDKIKIEIEHIKTELVRDRSKLTNSGFMTKAPKPVVNQARDRVERNEEKLRQLQSQLEKIS
jgi:valyl-tRNA synthetase